VPIRNAAGTGRIELYIDAVCEEELARVLARGFAKRTLDGKAQAECIAQCRRVAKRIDAQLAQAERAQLPVCKDPDDQKFLEAALVARAQFLITKDRELLALTRKRARLPFRILTPADWRRAKGT
jgi:predicted nucleic acid-binding protein